MVGTTGVQPRPIIASPDAAKASERDKVTCDKPAVAVAGGRPIFSDGVRLFAMN